MCQFRLFFFQAEDGIRDGRVTGVQTCALPISGVALGRGVDRLPGCAELAQPGPPRRPPDRRGDQIGRASCRERVEISVGVVRPKKKIAVIRTELRSKTTYAERHSEGYYEQNIQ